MNEIVVTIRSWLASILGTYSPVTYEEVVLVPDVANGGALTRTFTRVADGLAGVDYEYIFTALLLLVTVYCVFRLLGVLLSAICGVK